MTAAPGWYQDPLGRGRLHWWDGERWSSSDGSLDEAAAPLGAPARAAVEPDPGPPALPKGATRRVVSWLVLSFLAMFGAGAVLAFVEASEAVFVAGTAAALYGVQLWAAVRLSRDLGGVSFGEAYGFTFRLLDLWRGLLLYVVSMFATVTILVQLGDEFQGSNTEHLQDERSLFAHIALGLTIVVAAPIVEELFFRGMLQRALNNSFGWKLALAVQAFVFSLVHVDPFLGAGNVGLLVAIGVSGVAFGWAANRYRSLGPGIAAHAISNAVAFTLSVWG